jgi:hypothetical protein
MNFNPKSKISLFIQSYRNDRSNYDRNLLQKLLPSFAAATIIVRPNLYIA